MEADLAAKMFGRELVHNGRTGTVRSAWRDQDGVLWVMLRFTILGDLAGYIRVRAEDCMAAIPDGAPLGPRLAVDNDPRPVIDAGERSLA